MLKPVEHYGHLTTDYVLAKTTPSNVKSALIMQVPCTKYPSFGSFSLAKDMSCAHNTSNKGFCGWKLSICSQVMVVAISGLVESPSLFTANLSACKKKEWNSKCVIQGEDELSI